MSLITTARRNTRRIVNRILSPVTNRITGLIGGTSVASIIASARNALNIHPEQQTGSAYLVQKTPTLAGLVQDETPTRKDRTRLSCRASDFSTNQRFSGGNTSTGKTALSVFAWVRPTTLASTKAIIDEYDSSSSDRGWAIFFEANILQIIVSGDGGLINAKYYESTATFSANEWVHIGFVFVGGALTPCINGRFLTASEITKTVDGTVTTVHDSVQELEIGSLNGGLAYFNGQIQQPLIWESALTAAEVRDLYLQQYDDITAPTYGWFLDSDSAYGLTSSSPALAPTNSPDLFESDEIGGGDWLNEKGYNLSGVDPIPKRWDEELDSLGNAADNSESFGVARRDGQLEDGACLEFTGTEYATNANLVGTETVTSSGGTSTPTISAGRIDFTAGTCWGLTLSNGSIYPLGEGAGTVAYDVVNDEPLLLVNSPDWGQQDNYFWNENQGCSSRLLFSDFGVVLDNDIPEIAIDKAFSIRLGITTGADLTGNNQIFACYDSASNSYLNITTIDTAIVVGFYNVSYLYRLESAVSANTDYSITYTYDGSGNPVLTVNGVAGTSSTKTFTVNAFKPIFGQRRSDNATQFFDGIINSFKIYSDATFNTQIYGVDGSELWEDTIGSNNGTVLGTATTVSIPALADGSVNDANDYPLTNPAGPWLYEGLGDTYVNFDVVPNANQWLEQRWQAAEFDGTLDANINADTAVTGYPFSLEFDVRTEDGSPMRLVSVSPNNSQYHYAELSTSNGIFVKRRLSATDPIATNTGFTLINGQWHSIKITFESSTSFTIDFDGVVTTFSGLTEVLFSSGATTDGLWVGQYRALLGSSPEGKIKNVVVKQGTTSTNDQPLLGTSLDLSDNLFHGTDTDNNYNRLTDVSYTAGDTVEQPFSVNDDTSGRVSELIQFIFPVTTLSSTPTINQTVYEDGNTITEDSILISES